MNGLVQTRDLAEYLATTESTVRAWRKRHADWVALGRPASNAIHAQFPEPAMDPQDPDKPFLINGGPVYPVAAAVKFGMFVAKHERKAGNPQWLKAVPETA